MRRISILTVVALVVFLGCSGSAPKSELRENPLRLDEVGENDTSWVDLFALGETVEAWACFGTPDEYDNEKEVVAVVIYRYKDRPTLEGDLFHGTCHQRPETTVCNSRNGGEWRALSFQAHQYPPRGNQRNTRPPRQITLSKDNLHKHRRRGNSHSVVFVPRY